MIEFTPKSPEELAADRVWPEGIYPFTVRSAEETVSKKSGNPMFAIEIVVYSDAGREKTIKDWLLISNLEKLSQFCRFTGLEDLYNEGKLSAEDMENREGYVMVKIEKPKPPGHKDYDERNKIKNIASWYCDKPKDRPDAQEMEARRKELEKGLTDGTDEDLVPF